LNFEELYHKNKNLVYNLALHYTQQTEDAQEITQDVFVIAYQNLNNFRQESGLSTWLYRITVNKSLDFLRAKKRKKRFGFVFNLFFDNNNESKLNLTSNSYHPGVQLEDKEALTELFRHINKLPDNQKTALILNKIEQKTQTEVAEIMNLSPKAVESLVQRAKTNLAKKLKE
jgi:RNA polymerase sigma-70 factor (ECF subfamily)